MAEAPRKMRVLVLGASGKLGRMLRRHWHEAPPDHMSIYWQYRKNPPPGGIVWQPGEAVPEALEGLDGIVALWGVTPGPGRELAENRALGLAAMELGAALGAGRVLHCSSAAVYEPGPAPLREAQAGGRLNAYGAAKLDMERAVTDWAKAHPAGPRACNMRLANIAGADSLSAALARNPLQITLDRFDDGEGPWRSYLSVPALARVLPALLGCDARALPGAVNIAGATPCAMEALARACDAEVAWRPAPQGAAPMVQLDTGALAGLTDVPDESAADLAAAWRSVRAAP